MFYVLSPVSCFCVLPCSSVFLTCAPQFSCSICSPLSSPFSRSSCSMCCPPPLPALQCLVLHVLHCPLDLCILPCSLSLCSMVFLFSGSLCSVCSPLSSNTLCHFLFYHSLLLNVSCSLVLRVLCLCVPQCFLYSGSSCYIYALSPVLYHS